MNQEKMGKFISLKRKEKNLTQSELAEKMHVSSKTISRWETGFCMPDLSLLGPLSEILGVTLNDLMNGEIVDNKDYQTTFEKNVVSLIEKKKNYKLPIILLISIIIVVISIFQFINDYQMTLSYDRNRMKLECLNDIEISSDIYQHFDTCKYKFSIENTDGVQIMSKVVNQDLFVTIKQDFYDYLNHQDIQNNCNIDNRSCFLTWDIFDNKNYNVYYTMIDLDKITNTNINEIKESSTLIYEKRID